MYIVGLAGTVYKVNNMKHAFIIIFVFLICLGAVAETISSSQLAGTIWEDVDSKKTETKRSDTITFKTSETVISEGILSPCLLYSFFATLTSQSYWPLVDITIKKQFDYYLTDYKPEHFDSTKVGTETRGYYLVTYCRQPKGMSCYEILSCDLDTGDMYLSYRMNPGVIGGSGREVVIHYKLIKRPN